jgi:hypothetical protein
MDLPWAKATCGRGALDTAERATPSACSTPVEESPSTIRLRQLGQVTFVGPAGQPQDLGHRDKTRKSWLFHQGWVNGRKLSRVKNGQGLISAEKPFRRGIGMDELIGQHVADAVRTMSQCCSANATRASVCSRKPSVPFPRGADPGLQSATMNDIASWLRAQIPSSTDADRLERLAREAERQVVLRSGIATMVKERTPSKPPG